MEEDGEHNDTLDENVLSENEPEHEPEPEPEPGTRRFSWVYSPGSFFPNPKTSPRRRQPNPTLLIRPIRLFFPTQDPPTAV